MVSYQDECQLDCEEQLSEEREGQIATPDRCSQDQGRLRMLLSLEGHVACHPFFNTVQKGYISPKDRDETLDYMYWLLYNCDWMEEFQIAVSFLDRYLARNATKKDELRGIALGCILMAAKVNGDELSVQQVAKKGCMHHRLVKVMAARTSAILNYEMKVGVGLGWDGTAVTPLEIINELKHHLSIPVDWLPPVEWLAEQVSNFFICDSSKIGVSASLIASMSLVYAVELKLPHLLTSVVTEVLQLTECELEQFQEHYMAGKKQLLHALGGSSTVARTPTTSTEQYGCSSVTGSPMEMVSTPTDSRDIVADMFGMDDGIMCYDYN